MHRNYVRGMYYFALSLRLLVLIHIYSQVPEDIIAILNDPSLSSDGENLTTKEILKRYGDIRSSAIPQPSPSTASPSSARPQRHNGRAGMGHADPNAWQNESSVRHIGGGGYGGANY